MTLKRTFDIAASVVGIALLSPVFAAVSVASALHFRSNPFHLTDRVGKDGVKFNMIKFKSMDEIRDQTGKLLPDEKRSTGYGHFLRSTAIDELPQLINILKGDMSFVGPRPRSMGLSGNEEIPAEYRDILSVRPGLTGVWQVAAIGSKEKTSVETRMDLDAQYVRNNPTFTKDLLLMIKTIPAVFLGHDGESLSTPLPKPDHLRKPQV